MSSRILNELLIKKRVFILDSSTQFLIHTQHLFYLHSFLYFARKYFEFTFVAPCYSLPTWKWFIYFLSLYYLNFSLFYSLRYCCVVYIYNRCNLKNWLPNTVGFITICRSFLSFFHDFWNSLRYRFHMTCSIFSQRHPLIPCILKQSALNMVNFYGFEFL